MFIFPARAEIQLFGLCQLLSMCSQQSSGFIALRGEAMFQEETMACFLWGDVSEMKRTELECV